MSNPQTLNDGTKIWLNISGLAHKDDGPAVEQSDGTNIWYINGKIHREDGPAIEYADGGKRWYINDKQIF
jgi:hypothetical protein